MLPGEPLAASSSPPHFLLHLLPGQGAYSSPAAPNPYAQTFSQGFHPSQRDAAPLFPPPSQGLTQDLEWVGERSWLLSPGWAHRQGHTPTTGLPACHLTIRASALNAEVLSASGVSLLKCESPWEGYGLSANT